MIIIVSSGQTVTSVAIRHGNAMIIENGGTAVDTRATPRATIVLSHGGLMENTFIGKDASAFVYGHAVDTLLKALGNQTIEAGGIALDTTASRGGIEVVLSSAIATDTVLSGGKQTVLGGTARGTVVLKYGSALAIAGGVLSATSVGSGGTEFVYSGGTSVDTIVSAGGHAYITLNGVATDTTVQNGGMITISQGGSETGLSLTAGGTLDLPGMTFINGGTAILSGHLLTISEGSVTSTLSLKGGYAHATFVLSKDAGSGTTVTLTDIKDAAAADLLPAGPTAACLVAGVLDYRERDAHVPGVGADSDHGEAVPTGIMPLLFHLH